MGWEALDTATRRGSASHGRATVGLARYRPQIAVSMLVAIVLVGGRFYASRVSERASQVVYSASLEEVEAEELGDPRYGPLRLRLKNANAAVEAAAVEARRWVRLNERRK